MTSSDKPPISESGNLTSFVQALERQKIAVRSIEAYATDVRIFLRHLKMNPEDLDARVLTNLQSQDIENYLEHLIDKHVSSSTIRRTLASLRRFFAFLLDKGFITSDPSQSVFIRSGRKSTISSELIISMFHHLVARQDSKSEIETLRYLRDEVILLLMVFHGLRQYQVPTLLLSSIKQPSGILTLTVTADFGIRLEGLILKKLHKYLLMRNSNAEAIFLEPRESEPVSVASISAVLKELSHALQFECTPKRLFDTYLSLQEDQAARQRLLEILQFDSQNVAQRAIPDINAGVR